MKVKRKVNFNLDQSGVASILITLIMMIVISLIVFGFAEIANRDQKESLDSQLGTQAFYAAESGVNAVIQGINSYLNWAANGPGASPPNHSIELVPGDMNHYEDIKYCYGSTVPGYGLIGNAATNPQYYYEHYLDSSHNIAYSCVLIGGQSSLTLNGIQPNQSKITQTCPANACASDPSEQQLNISWSNTSTTSLSGCGGTSTFYADPSYSTNPWTCNVGALRVDYFQENDAGFPNANYASTQKATATLFLYPTSSASPTEPSQCNYDSPETFSPTSPKCYGNSPNNGLILDGNCTDPDYPPNTGPFCVATINDVTWQGYIRIIPLYRAANIDIIHPGGGSKQVEIDVTGRAQNITRRVAVDVSLLTAPQGPNYALQTTESICKDFTTNYSAYSSSTNPQPFSLAPGLGGFLGCTYN